MKKRVIAAIAVAFLASACGVKSERIPNLSDGEAVLSVLMRLSAVPPGQPDTDEANRNREGLPGSDRKMFWNWINRQFGDASVHMRDPSYWGSPASTIGAAIAEERATEAEEAKGPSVEELNAMRRAKAAADLERDAPQAHGMGTTIQ